MNTSYADKLKKNKVSPLSDFAYPNEEQGILFSCMLDYKLRDYLVAIKDLVHGPQNIIAASKVSQNRVILFLKNEEMVETFLTDHGGFAIESNFIKCRKLKSPTKRIIFSNVSLTIPNDVLLSYIAEN